MAALINRLALLLLVFTLFSATTGAAQKAVYKKAIKEHHKAYKVAFLKNDNGPLDKKGVKALRFFKADAKGKVHAQFQKLAGEEPFEMPTFSGETQTYVRYGVLEFDYQGQSSQLTVYRNLRTIRLPGFRDQLFLPFKDSTNGKATYGGGRYLNLKIGDMKDGKLELDFNKCYNPYCAYQDGYICPIPPAENHLDFPVLVGEKAPRKAKR